MAGTKNAKASNASESQNHGRHKNTKQNTNMFIKTLAIVLKMLVLCDVSFWQCFRDSPSLQTLIFFMRV